MLLTYADESNAGVPYFNVVDDDTDGWMTIRYVDAYATPLRPSLCTSLL